MSLDSRPLFNYSKESKTILTSCPLKRTIRTSKYLSLRETQFWKVSYIFFRSYFLSAKCISFCKTAKRHQTNMYVHIVGSGTAVASRQEHASCERRIHIGCLLEDSTSIYHRFPWNDKPNIVYWLVLYDCFMYDI